MLTRGAAATADATAVIYHMPECGIPAVRKPDTEPVYAHCPDAGLSALTRSSKRGRSAAVGVVVSILFALLVTRDIKFVSTMRARTTRWLALMGLVDTEIKRKRKNAKWATLKVDEVAQMLDVPKQQVRAMRGSINSPFGQNLAQK